MLQDYENIYQELQNKRKFLNGQMNKQTQDNNDCKSLMEATQKILQRLNQEKNDIQNKYKQYQEQVDEIVKRNKQSQFKFQQSEDNLYKLKTNLQDELLAWMPQVGLRHQKLLKQEQVDVKIRRHQLHNQEKQNQEKVLRGVSEDNMKYIQSNISKLAYPEITVSPSKNQNQDIVENESLALSALTKSVTTSQQRPNTIKFNQKQQISQAQFNYQESKDQMVRGQQKSLLNYGGFQDDEEDQ